MHATGSLTAGFIDPGVSLFWDDVQQEFSIVYMCVDLLLFYHARIRAIVTNQLTKDSGSDLNPVELHSLFLYINLIVGL